MVRTGDAVRPKKAMMDFLEDQMNMVEVCFEGEKAFLYEVYATLEW